MPLCPRAQRCDRSGIRTGRTGAVDPRYWPVEPDPSGAGLGWPLRTDPGLAPPDRPSPAPDGHSDAESLDSNEAGIAARGNVLGQFYRRMVNESMARKDISFKEMAHLALHSLMDPHAAEHDPDSVMAILFETSQAIRSAAISATSSAWSRPSARY